MTVIIFNIHGQIKINLIIFNKAHVWKITREAGRIYSKQNYQFLSDIYQIYIFYYYIDIV